MNAPENDGVGCIDLARGKPTLQSSVLPGHEGCTASRAVDGSDDATFFHTGHHEGAWWQVDLGRTFLIDSVALYNRPGFEDRARRLTLLSSLDGATWSVLYRKSDDAVFGSSAANHFEATPAASAPARFVRVVNPGFGCLHLTRVSVYGRSASLEEDEAARQAQAARETAHRAGRSGSVVPVDTFEVFLDDEYSAEVKQTLHEGTYEARERRLVRELLRPGDRVLEAGTAIGLVSMNAASIVGADSVITYDANPLIARDAQRNFGANGLPIDSRVGVLRNRASWDHSQTLANFYISKHLWGSRLFATPTDGDIVDVVQIPYVLLEDQIEASRANVLLCDIEGGEADLLTEADLSSIDLIVLETHYWAVGRPSVDRMMRALVAAGFNVDLDLTASQVVVLRKAERDVIL